MTIGERIKLRREELELTQEELANMLGYKSRSSINKIELGGNALTQKKIQLIATALQTTPSYIMGWEDKENTINIDKIENLYKPEFKKIPIIGSIACGTPILSEENIEGYADCEINTVADFALTCKGDSMINARIYDGDIVFIKVQPIVNNGEIAVVCIGDEATLKRVYLTNESITLVAENSQFPPLVYVKEQMNDVKIVGKAVAFLSYLN